MRKILILTALIAALGLSFDSQPAQSADATAAWNQVAATYNFSTYPGSLSYPTFDSAYSGSNFSADFAGILSDVASLMDTSVPPWGGGDPFNYITRWPEN